MNRITYFFLVVIAGCKGADSEHRLTPFLKSHSVVELGASLRTNSSWQKLDQGSFEDRNFAALFVIKCKAAQRGFSVPSRFTIESYATLISGMSEGGGYLDLLLMDSTYRLAIGQIAQTVVNYPERAAEMGTLLDLLGPGPWKAANIGRMLSSQASDNFEQEFRKWSGTEVVKQLTAKFGRGPGGTESRSSALIQKELKPDLIYRMMETDIVTTYSLPGAISYVAHGGDLRTIGQHDARELDALMGDDVFKFKYPLMNLRRLRVSYLLTVVQGFGNTERMSAEWVRAFD